MHVIVSHGMGMQVLVENFPVAVHMPVNEIC